GFATIIAVGTALLASPFASRSGQPTGLVDALFTSVSAASDTGLAVVPTAEHWNVFGQAVLAVLMFLGGIGIMAGAALAVLLGRRATLERRAQVSDTFGGNLGTARDIVRGTLVFAVAVQLVGAAALVVIFLLDGTQVPHDGPIWNAVFQSISSFNNAGL